MKEVLSKTVRSNKPEISHYISAPKNTKPIWTDYYLNQFKWYRKIRKRTWYKHQFTKDALDLSFSFQGTFWALYDKINRYSDVIETQNFKK